MTTLTPDFCRPLDHRALQIMKWAIYPDDVIPMWVADMDFASPDSVTEAIQRRAGQAAFGYNGTPPELLDAVTEHLQKHFNWQVEREHILSFPGMVLAINIITRALGQPGEGVLMQTPVYGPFLLIPANNGLFAQTVDMTQVIDDDHTFHYEIDFEAFERAISPQTRFFYLCNPHNPGGMALSEETLRRLGEICHRHNIHVISDEIHSDLLLGQTRHIPFGSLGSELAGNSVTLFAPSKTFNIPGLPCSFAVVPNADLREKISITGRKLGVHVAILSYSAALGAYQGGSVWLEEVRAYLLANRDLLVQAIQDLSPIRTTVPDATYLAWLDCSALRLPADISPHDFFLKEAKVALSPGDFFGRAGEKFVRLNFACHRDRLEAGLERMAEAIARL